MKSKRKSIIIGIILILLLIILVLWLQSHYSRKSFDELLGTKAGNITRIVMRSGDTGQAVSTTDKQKIAELLSLLEDNEYSKSFDQSRKTGFSYVYYFFQGETQILSMLGHGDYIQLNDTYYDVSKEILLEDLSHWFESLPVNEKKE
jgi:hypothetical protein